MKTITEQNPPLESVMAQEPEKSSIKHLESILQLEGAQPKLVGVDGQEIPIPESVYQILHQAVHALALGKVISVVIQDRELTTQKAADILKVSRPYLIKLLDQGEIPCIRVGTHRRVRFDDLMKYKEERDTKRREGIKQFTQFLEAEGFYDDESSELDQ
ncbi:helix-turn-helix domain-containing protein [Dolichospermum flos-aquae]|jgi:excisionase family DNA binding protein|uniref:Helix-turn-helix domain-containing protein n=1 Tax=Dolichospermum flos-aquae CCAP 1403/13F TaxID=315271 RepID=A0A6H2C4V8_DOLFA|nr:helix-turn-helix domain-containing protein [Dolichospermum flos-aquae]QJB45989.1 helix-turn-helix domain-containing protein [Dolichospermum flos-aquae CCAP 1403/13F]